MVQQAQDPMLSLWGCGFDPWPRSVGCGSGIATSCGIGLQLQLWFEPWPRTSIFHRWGYKKRAAPNLAKKKKKNSSKLFTKSKNATWKYKGGITVKFNNRTAFVRRNTYLGRCLMSTSLHIGCSAKVSQNSQASKATFSSWSWVLCSMYCKQRSLSINQFKSCN